MTRRAKYSDTFKARAVQRICAPGGPSAYALSRELDISPTTLYSWVKLSKSVIMKRDEPRRPQDWSAAEKFKAVLEADSLSDEELGKFLRRKGLHEAHLKEWREQAEAALGQNVSKPDVKLKKEVKRLTKEVRRKDKALAETAALLVLSKKLHAFLGEEGENF